jgi:hypothetical protein
MYNVPGDKVSAIGNGVDWKKFDFEMDSGKIKAEYGIGPMDPTVLFCGRMVWQKGPDILVEAIPAILKTTPSAKFVFIGDGDMRAGLEARTRHLGVAHTVRFLGYRNGDELVRLIKASDVVCVPSRNEPFGIVVLEGWAAGKPVVVTENGGPSEFVRHEINGLKIYSCPDSVIWGINRVFSDFERARQMGRNGRQFLEERFGWDKVVEQTLGVYRQLCPEPAPQPVCEVVPQVPVEAVQPEPIQRDDSESVKFEIKLLPATPETVPNKTEAVLDSVNAVLTNTEPALKQERHCVKNRNGRKKSSGELCERSKEPHQIEEGLTVPVIS